MEKEVKRPSVCATRLEVWKFKKNHLYTIPPEHHLNMVELKGCSKKTLASYLEYSHVLSDEALLFLLKNNNTEMFQFIAEHAIDVSLASETEKTIIAQFGYEMLLKNNIRLSESNTLKFLQETNAENIPSSYLRCLTFSPTTEACLLELKNSELASQYLANHIVYPENRRLILLYDDPEVYRAFDQRNNFNDVFTDIIKTKSLEIFKIALKYLHPILLEDEKILIDKNEPTYVQAFVEQVNFSDEAMNYLVQKASNEVFAVVVGSSSFSTNDCPDCFYQRLFEPQHLELLKKYLQENYLPGKFEVRLLESGDKELIDLYFENGGDVFSSEAKVWLLDHPQSEYASSLLEKMGDLGYFGEAWLFKSGDDEKIQHYLSLRAISAISEAALFKYASLPVLREYFAHNTLDEPAVISLIHRKDFELLKTFWELGLRFDGISLEIFLAESDDDTVLAYFMFLEQNDEFCDLACEEDSEEISIMLYQHHLVKSASFFVSKGRLSNQAEYVMVQMAPRELIYEYIKTHSLAPSAEEFLLCHYDKELVREYVSKYKLDMDNESFLFCFDDWDLIKFYQKEHGFSDAFIVDGIES